MTRFDAGVHLTDILRQSHITSTDTYDFPHSFFMKSRMVELYNTDMADHQIQIKSVRPTIFSQEIILMQSPSSRAINVGYLHKNKSGEVFISGRQNVGAVREKCTYTATVESLRIPLIQSILKRHNPRSISTITLLRETLACRIGEALADAGVGDHYGDAFVGATHIKRENSIRTAYLYENTEGLVSGGLWIIADSICMGRNLLATLQSLLPKLRPTELLFISPIASRVGIEILAKLPANMGIPTTFTAWGALFGVDERTRYDMPWGHSDTEPLDPRDRKTFTGIFGKRLCVGGDFGNDYYCPPLAIDLFNKQLTDLHIQPSMPSAKEVMSTYTPQEILIIE